MFRASFLCWVFFAIFGVSWGHKDLYEVPDCEDKGPQDVYLDFSYTNLTTLSRSHLFDQSIKCLNYEGNRINQIERGAFDDVPKLFYLNLANNPIDVENFMSAAVSNLETLILDGPFSQPHYRLYQPLVQYDDFEKLPFLPDLRKLSLRYCGDSPGRASFWLALLEVPNLTHLYLSGNELTNITNLAGMKFLTHVNLDDNKMTYISGSFFTNLQYLSMNRNNIRNVCGTLCKPYSMTAHGMHNLKYLSLAENEIDNIGFDAFVDLESLLVLNLAGNKIQDFEQHALDNMTKLENLTLDRNNLASVPDICALQELEVLSLNENRIVDLDETNFCNMTKLAMIYLRKNGLTNIADKTFDNLPALSILDLAWNSLYILPQNWIMPHNRLNVLHLDGNKFTEIGHMSLERLDALNTLSFFHNPIDEISIKSLMELPQNITIKLSLDSQCLLAPL